MNNELSLEQAFKDIEAKWVNHVDLQQEIDELESQGFISGEKCWTCD